jgi:tetratricopeptide (TPR) repeat protein
VRGAGASQSVTPPPPPPPDTLDALAALIEHNLVVRDDADAVPRFRLLETIREFASERLTAAGEEERARRAHLHFLLHLARENDLERLDAEVGERLSRLQQDDANLHAGIEWAIEHDPDTALALLAALGGYWYLADRKATFRTLHRRALAASAGAGHNPFDRAHVLTHATAIANVTGDHATAASLAAASRAFAEQIGDARSLAYASLHEGDIAVSNGDDDGARALHEAALAQFTTLGDHGGIFHALTLLGIAAQQRGDADAAVVWFERLGALVAKHRLPARYQAHYLGNVADAYRQIGRRDEAMAACHKSLRLAQETGWRAATAGAQHLLCRLLLDGGAIAETPPLIASSLAAFWETGDHWSLAQVLELAAPIMTAMDRPEPAARLLGAAAALRDAMPYPIGAGERDALARWQGETRAALGDDAFSRAWTTGQEQPLDAIVADAQTTLAAITHRPSTEARAMPAAGTQHALP